MGEGRSYLPPRTRNFQTLFRERVKGWFLRDLMRGSEPRTMRPGLKVRYSVTWSEGQSLVQCDMN